MKADKLLLFSCVFLLNGCFMHNNFKCALEGSCNEESFEMSPEEIAEQELRNKEIKKEILKAEQEEKIYIKKAKTLIEQRCILFGWKIGTSDFVSCNKARYNVYEGDVFYKYDGSYKRAYDVMAQQYKDDERTCAEYGVKRGTPEFNKCRVKLEQDEMKRQIIVNQREKERINRELSKPVQIPINCRSYTAFGQTYTQCY